MRLLDDLAALGIRLHVLPDGRLGYRASRGILTPELRERIVTARRELLALLGPCPSCRTPLDRGRCWRCMWRQCSRCGKQTGSAFIETCCACGLRADDGGES